MDFCRVPSLEDITLISAEQFTSGHLSEGVEDRFVAHSYLKRREHRTHIDTVIFGPGKKNATPWGHHNGHEFVLVLKGKIFCEFAVEKHEKGKHFFLETGMAIVFPSSLYHIFGNTSDSEEAILVVGKPTYGRPAEAKD